MAGLNKSQNKKTKDIDSISNKIQNDEDVVEKYLISQQKPFSINDLVLNLNNKFKKTPLLKILDDLHKKEKIIIVTFGKTSIFASKDIVKEISIEQRDEEVAGNQPSSNPLLLLEQILQLKEEQTEMNRDFKQLNDCINNEKKNPSNKELPTLIKTFEGKLAQVCEAIEELKKQEDNIYRDSKNISSEYNNGNNSNVPQTNKDLLAYIEKSEKILTKEMKTRKQIIKNILNLLLQNKKPQELKNILDDIGFEETH